MRDAQGERCDRGAGRVCGVASAGCGNIADVNQRYDHRAVEKKWQREWEETGIYQSNVDWSRPKHYALTMLPYPSGDLHIGHWYAMTPSDARARYMRMRGYNVLFPMGFDAFGLPAENAAIQANIHPWEWTYANIERMREQLRTMGTMIDWRREAVSCTPGYYRWSQWLFSRLYEAGLAYRGEALVNWSPSMQTVLANEQVMGGLDERTGQPVIQKMMEQWFYRITRYAEELLVYDGIDWPAPVAAMQTNWIGRSVGARVIFPLFTGETNGRPDPDRALEVFTTRPDTLFGATFMVLAPEHPLVDVLTSDKQREAVDDYRERAAARSEMERTDLCKEKTGVDTGGYALNPATGRRIPVWVADYVLMSYGSGAIMAVPGEDGRDWEFARRYGLPVLRTVQPPDDFPGGAYEGDGPSINSQFLDGLFMEDSKQAMMDWLEDNNHGRREVQYRLRDWLISRQRYWGCPIPILYGPDGAPVPVPDGDLPVELPADVDFQPTGRSPLLEHAGFLNAVIPGSDPDADGTGTPAVRETDTMDTFMCSSWYHLRYLSPHYEQGPFDPEEAAYWLPVDLYTGGAEHAVMHLLYTRFFNKALRDMGVFDETMQAMRARGRDPEGVLDEPMLMLRNQGQVLGEERAGDLVVAEGERRGDRMVADKVRVVASATDAIGGATGAAVAGEVIRRSKNLLWVRPVASPSPSPAHSPLEEGAPAPSSPETSPESPSDKDVQVEVPDTAQVDIPAIPGPNTLLQLREKLDVQRMSKSKGNVVNPDELVEEYGADTVRAYLMFAFEWEKGGPWNSRGIRGAHRFITDLWRLGATDYKPNDPDDVNSAAERDLRRRAHQAIDRVGRDMENLHWNTAVAELMVLRNALAEARAAGVVSREVWREALRILVLLAAPIAPHVTEEVWRGLGHRESVHCQPWPESDPEAAADEEVTMVVQVNGKVRARFQVPVGVTRDEALALAAGADNVQRHLGESEIRRVVDRLPNLLNLVV